MDWDLGLQFDINNTPSYGDVTPYLDLIPNANQTQPNFIAALVSLLQPVSDQVYLLKGLSSRYDVDTAIGQQLDTVGIWVGVSRGITTPLTDVYFSFYSAEVGFDMGTWMRPTDPTTGLVSLPDDSYRTLIKATIAANHWDGTIPNAYSIWQTLFLGTGYTVIIIDRSDMSMDMGFVGKIPDAVTLGLLTGGYLDLRPDGVRINDYILPTIDGTLFGFDAESDVISGFDVGGFARFVAPT